MPMPLPNTAWPPPPIVDIYEQLEDWDALWIGTPEALEASAMRNQQVTRQRPGLGGAVINAVAKFWSRGQTDLTVPQSLKSHVPIGSDMCQASSDIIWADPPKILSDDKGTQVQIDEFIDKGLLSTLAAASEVGAALGGSYRRAMFDMTRKTVFASRVDADMALPEFSYGQLVAVTLFKELSRNSNVVLRHLEHHQLDAAGNGEILVQVYQGTPDNIGRPVEIDPGGPLKALMPLLVDGDTIKTESPGLAIVYVPNQTPSRKWRKHPIGANLGRSDFEGVEGHMDDLDRAWSSLMHELDMAKAKIIVPDYMLTTHEAGKGQSYNQGRTIYSGLNMSPDQQPPPPTLIQPAIRVDEHLRIMQEATEVILRSAGYSAQTFGEDESGGAITKAEVDSKNTRSGLTRLRKIRHEQPALHELVTKMLWLAKVKFGAKVDPEKVSVEFAQASNVNPLENAQIIQFLAVAEAASTETKVRMAHPDWDDIAVTKEVTSILNQGPEPVPDAEGFGQNGNGIIPPEPEAPTE